MGGIKDKIESNPIIYLIVAVVSAVGVAAGVQQYFYAEQEKIVDSRHQSELRDLDSKLASVKRGMTGNEYFDIRKLLLLPGETSNLPQNAKFFSEDQFYASSNDPDWTFSRATELDLASELAGTAINMPPQMTKAAKAFPLYLWRGKQTQRVENSELLHNVFPYITLQKVPIDRVKELVGIGVSMADDEDKDSQPAKDVAGLLSESRTKSAEEFTSKLEGVFRSDIVGSFFTSKLLLQMQVAITSSQTTFTLVEIQKVGNVLYSQTLITLHDAKIDGKLLPLYYVRQELMIISTADNLYLIQTLIPSEDPAPRGQVYSSVTKWMNDFRVRVS